MHIVLDARWIFPSLSGIGIHTRELIREFARLENEHRFTLLYQDRQVLERVRVETGFDQNPRFDTERVPYGLFSVKNQLALPFVLSRLRADIYHSTNWMIPLFSFPRNRPGRIRCAVTLHDLIPMMIRDHAPGAKKSRFYPVYRQLMLQVAARGDRIITVSEASKRDIVAQLRVPEERVTVVYNGIGDGFSPAESRPATPKTVLYVGRFDPYKNAELVVDAVKELHAAGHAVRLHLVGRQDERYPEVGQRLQGAPFEVQWDEDLSDAALAAAYREAHVLVLPSRYEGFGLPVIEAMKSGTPVVCADASSLPEVAGDAALLVPPGDFAGLYDAIERVLKDDALSAGLVEKGLVQAAKFSWEKAARETLAVYEGL